MPLCVHCAQILPHLYTVYQSANNVRLEQCPSCHLFADPYVEHDHLIVLLDLILLKRAVYRHLLFNRGTPPRRATEGSNAQSGDEKDSRSTTDAPASWLLTLQVGVIVVLVDAFIRWTELRPHMSSNPNTWLAQDYRVFGRILVGCFIETVAFHVGITVSAFIVLTILRRWEAWRPQSKSNASSSIRQLLRYSHIPLCLLYSSVTKFFLLFLLAVWDLDLPPPSDSAPVLDAPQYLYTIHFDNPVLKTIWEALDDDKLDRRWIVRNVLGGMAAGFGLRVVLDCHPSLTTLIILTGWAIKTGVSNVVGGFVGQDIVEAWLAYSIP